MILVGHMIRQIFTTFLKILMSSLEKDTWNKCEIVVSGKWKFNFELIRNLPPPWLPPTTMSSSARLLSFSTCTLCHIWCQINCSGSLYQYGITDLSSNTCLLTVGRKSFFPNISRHFFFWFKYIFAKELMHMPKKTLMHLHDWHKHLEAWLQH